MGARVEPINDSPEERGGGLLALAAKLAERLGVDDENCDEEQALEDAYALRVEDLVADGNGEVHLEGAGELVVLSPVPVAAFGVSPSRKLAGGTDVTGLRFVTLASGLTMFMNRKLSLIVRPAAD